MMNQIKFETFPSDEEFSEKTGLSPEQADVVLRWIKRSFDPREIVARDSAEVAAHAIQAGMDYKRVAVVFAYTGKGHPLYDESGAE